MAGFGCRVHQVKHSISPCLKIRLFAAHTLFLSINLTFGTCHASWCWNLLALHVPPVTSQIFYHVGVAWRNDCGARCYVDGARAHTHLFAAAGRLAGQCSFLGPHRSIPWTGYWVRGGLFVDWYTCAIQHPSQGARFEPRLSQLSSFAVLLSSSITLIKQPLLLLSFRSFTSHSTPDV